MYGCTQRQKFSPISTSKKQTSEIETVNSTHLRGEQGRNAVAKFKGKSLLRHFAPDRKCRPEGKSYSALWKHKWAGLACNLFIVQCTYVGRRRAESCLYADTRTYTDGLHLAGGNGTIAAEMAPSGRGYCPLQSSTSKDEARRSNQTIILDWYRKQRVNKNMNHSGGFFGVLFWVFLATFAGNETTWSVTEPFNSIAFRRTSKTALARHRRKTNEFAASK